MKTRTRFRKLEQVFEDGLWPHQGLDLFPEETRRHQAIAEVLCTIPEDDYNRLKECVFEFEWFIPDYRRRGEVRPFFPNMNIDPPTTTSPANYERLPTAEYST